MYHNKSVSVVLCTYNGEQYIQELLGSISKQTQLPDEIVIVDDVSTDNTIEILTKQKDEFCGINYKVISNRHNLGWRKNFAKAINIATGDILFLADQDDIWCENKIEVMCSAMEEAEAEVLACNLEPIYERDSKRINSVYIRNYGLNRLEQVDFRDQGFQMVRPGCTICFRNSIKDYFNNIWIDQLAHDETIWAIGLVRKSLYIVNEVLMKFRRHGKNNSPNVKKNRSGRVIQLKRLLMKTNSLLECSEEMKIDQGTVDILMKTRSSLISRINLFESKDTVGMFKQLILNQCDLDFRNRAVDFVSYINS